MGYRAASFRHEDCASADDDPLEQDSGVTTQALLAMLIRLEAGCSA